MNGGYVIIDAKGLDLTETDPQEISGSWKAVKAAVEAGKPIVAHNCIYGTGVPVSPVTCFAMVLDTDEIVLVGATLHIHVKDDDTCTVLDVAPST